VARRHSARRLGQYKQSERFDMAMKTYTVHFHLQAPYDIKNDTDTTEKLF
jgi:hypothetical protein